MAFNITPAALLSGANNLNNLLTNSGRIDIVGILNQETLKQIFVDARPVRATVRETSRVMDYPVETGAVLSDHKVIMPTEIEMVCIIRSDTFSTAFQEMRGAWLNATELSVQTRMGTYRNMIITELPHVEDSDMANAVVISIRLREVLFVVPASVAPSGDLANYSPRDPQNQSLVDRGLLSAIAASGTVISYFDLESIWGT